MLASAAALAAACGRAPSESPSGFDVAAEFAKVTAARATAAAARGRLAATPVPGGGDAHAEFDAAYARSQRLLARFLTVALNEAPGRPETKAALDLYAGDAVANANYAFEHDGNRTAALADLARARRAYEALGVAAPPAVAAAIDRLGREPRPTPTVSPAPAPGAGARPSRRHRRPAPGGAGRRPH